MLFPPVVFPRRVVKPVPSGARSIEPLEELTMSDEPTSRSPPRESAPVALRKSVVAAAEAVPNPVT